MSIKTQLITALIVSMLFFPVIVIIDGLVNGHESNVSPGSVPKISNRQIAGALFVVYSELWKEHQIISRQIQELKGG